MADWRARLIAAIDLTGKSDREISLALKFGPNFVNELRHSSKTPSIDRVLALTSYLGLSASFVVSGVDLSGSDEELLRVFLRLAPDDRRDLLALARKLVKDERAA